MLTMLDPLATAYQLAARRSVPVGDVLLVVDEVGPESAEAVMDRAAQAGVHPVAVARGMDAELSE